jgi:hypothetical protein
MFVSRREQIRQQQQKVSMSAAIPTWMSIADRLMIGIESPQPLPWDQFEDAARLGDDTQFAILEQRRFEQCEALPSPENDAIVGTAMVVWSAHYISVLKTVEQQDYPIATSGRALRRAIRNISAGSHINVFPETAEVYESLKMSNDVLPSSGLDPVDSNDVHVRKRDHNSRN